MGGRVGGEEGKWQKRVEDNAGIKVDELKHVGQLASSRHKS